MARDPRLAGLYALLAPPPGLAPTDLARRVSALVSGGARLVQLRDKSHDAGRRLALARALVSACHAGGALAIINDDVALAAAVGADGVHLGREDAALEAARLVLGPRAVLGASCYASLDAAGDAAAAGADYVAFGSVFPSATKPDAVRAPLALLGAARDVVDLPVCAIGGIDAGNARAVVAAGADMLAVQAVFERAADLREAAAALAAAFSPASPAAG